MPSASDPAITLIICTRNRAGPLAACLESVAALKVDRSWELVIVDNASTDDTTAVIAAFADRVSFPVSYVLGDRIGLSNARNAGLAVARGAIIAFTDDDCYPQADFLHQVAKAFDDPEVGFVTGRILLHDPSDFPVTINESVVDLDFAAGRYIAPGAVKGANLSFRRSALSEAGGFDPLFGSGAFFAAEDIDTTARISRHGWRGRYDPRIVVSHHHGRKAGDVGSLLKAYDIGRGAYHAKLLVGDGAWRNAWAGWRGLPRRALHRPVSAYHEIAGALCYVAMR